MPPTVIDVSRVNQADVAQMKRIETAIAQVIAAHRHNTPVEILTFALVRVLRLLVAVHPDKHALREMLVSFLREQEAARADDDPAARLILQ